MFSFADLVTIFDFLFFSSLYTIKVKDSSTFLSDILGFIDFNKRGGKDLGNFSYSIVLDLVSTSNGLFTISSTIIPSLVRTIF